MSHKRLIIAAVIVAVVIVMSVVAVIAVLVEDVVNPPDAGAPMGRGRGKDLALAA